MSLKQALGYLEDGHVFIMTHRDRARIFYNSTFEIKVDQSKFYYLECGSWSSLMYEGEWDFYLLQAKENKELVSGELAEKILTRKVLNQINLVFEK